VQLLPTRHLVEGDRLGKYEVLRRIANGTMTELYLTRTVGGIEKLLVLKRILPQCVSNASCVEMFLEETQLAATLHHPNIVQVHDVGLADGNYFFTMEHVHGEDLERIADAAAEKAVSISIDAALTIVTGLCAGLHYAHEKAGADGTPLKIVHCDVSPSNVVVSYDGAVKLLDFGMAGVATFHPHTVRSGLKGKLSYSSPELCRPSDPFDRRSDVFSVGVILYRLVTGRLPFSGKAELELRQQIMSGPPPLPSTIVPGCPPALEHIVMSALARDVDQRYASALDLQAALEDFAHEARLRVSPLVVSRLMSYLFPTRSEEWVHASTHAGTLVEENIARALVENDRHTDRSARDVGPAAVQSLTPPRTQQIRRPPRTRVITIPAATARASSPTPSPTPTPPRPPPTRTVLPPMPPIPAVTPRPPSSPTPALAAPPQPPSTPMPAAPPRPPSSPTPALAAPPQPPPSSTPLPAVTPHSPSSSTPLPAVTPRPPSSPAPTLAATPRSPSSTSLPAATPRSPSSSTSNPVVTPRPRLSSAPFVATPASESGGSAAISTLITSAIVVPCAREQLVRPPTATPAQVPLEPVAAITPPGTRVDVPVRPSSEPGSADWSWPALDESAIGPRDEVTQPARGGRRSLRRAAGAVVVACGLAGFLALN